MQAFRGLLSRRYLTVMMVGFLLTGFIAFLVGKNYVSQVELQEHHWEDLRQDLEKRSFALSYFFFERKNDLKNLAASREISTFFENQALGMSMEYGLRASLLAIQRSFDCLRQERVLGDDRIYTGIMLIDSSGECLVNTRSADAKRQDRGNWKQFLAPESRNPIILVKDLGGMAQVMISTPYFFKDAYAGQIIAWVSPEIVNKYLIQQGDKGPHRMESVIFFCQDNSCVRFHPMIGDTASLLPDLSRMKPGGTHESIKFRNDATQTEMIAIRVSIHDTPFSLVGVLPVAEAVGTISPWHLLAALGFLSVLLLGGIGIIWRTDRRNLILQTRLEEASQKEQEIEEKNRQLVQQISERQRVEEALKISHRFLEITNRHTKITPLLQEFVEEVQKTVQCKAAAIRVLDAQANIHYQAYRGFSREFCELESPLSIKSDECMCINVIKGTTDPQLPFYTPGGSFYMNATTRFLATVSEEEKGRTRNACNEFGYESVALVPIRLGDHILGLIHVADPQENMVPLQGVKQLEGIALQLGEAMQRVTYKAALDKLHYQSELILNSAWEGIIGLDPNGNYTFVNPAAARMLGYEVEELIGRHSHSTWHHTRPNGSPYPAEECPIYEAFRKGGIQHVTDEHLFRKDGTSFVVEAISTPIKDNGAILGAVVTFWDITERQRAEEALRRSEEKYRLLFNSGNDAIFVYSITEQGLPGKFTEVNDKACELFGYTREEFLQLSPFDLEVPEKHEYFGALAGKIFSVGNFLYETEAITKDGRMIPVEINCQRFVDLQDRPTGLSAVRDIVLRKQAEEALRETHEQLTTLIEAAPDPIFFKDAQGRYLMVNKAAEAIMGRPRKDLIGKTDKQFFPPEVAEQFRRHDAKLIQKRRPIRAEEYCIDDQGRELFFDSVKFPLFDSQGNVRGIGGMSRDITQRVVTEAALRRSEENLHTLFDTVEDFIWVLGLDGHILRINHVVVQRLGYSEEELLGKHVLVVHPADRREEAAAILADMAAGKADVCPVPLLAKDGTQIPVETRVTRGRWFDTGALFAVSRDITERQRAENRLRASLREKEVLLKEIHHRVKNNLQVVSSLLNLQSEYIKDEKALQVLRQSQDRIRTMAAIHARLYQASDLSQIDVAGYLHDLAVELFRSYEVSPENIALQVNIADIPLSVATAIPLGLIVNELVANSLRHAFPEGSKGEIRIDMHADDGKIAMVVADNGRGFPQDLDFRNTKTLGLELVIALTEQLDGTIELRREGGTVVELAIPQNRS